MATAVIYAPGQQRERERWRLMCGGNVRAHGESLAGVTSSWAAAAAMVEQGRADVIVVARHSHLPPGDLPPVRVVDGYPPEPAARSA